MAIRNKKTETYVVVSSKSFGISMEEDRVKVFVSKSPENHFYPKDKLEVITIEKIFSPQIRSLDFKKDGDSTLMHKLKQVKNDLKFCGYFRCIISEVFKETESLFVSVFYLLLFLIMLIVGLHHQLGLGVDCLGDPLLSICLIQSGILGGLINAINLSYFITETRSLPLYIPVETRNVVVKPPMPRSTLYWVAFFHPSLGQHYLRNMFLLSDTVRSLLFRLINSNISIKKLQNLELDIR
ncbi:hypothetical protein NPIL_462801 [Nephila pilipes]|uniref:Uncharacterized protein n=1 Tax=Nephila pilipes TaxID=299642 RepID=A0A8X6TTP2_NEPPI|nr:hypothetical protein NPIL_462801 [Nephila pilipes]